MGRLTLFAVVVAFLLASSTSAQQTVKPVSDRADQGAANSPGYISQSTAPSAMPPRDLLEMRGDIFMARKEFPSAVTVYSQLLVIEPKNAEIMNKIGVAYQQLGDLDRSGRFYKRAFHANKTFASAVNNYGTVEYEKKHYGKAIDLYKKAIVLRPEMATLYSNLGYAYFGIKEYPEAMKSFEQALSLDPDIFAHHGSYGTTVQQRGTTEPGLF